MIKNVKLWSIVIYTSMSVCFSSYFLGKSIHITHNILFFRIDPVLLTNPVQHETIIPTTSRAQPPKKHHSSTKPKKSQIVYHDDSQDTMSISQSPKQKREDQLFEIINELIKAKRKRKTKTKRLRLFDIIDNIPVTSEEESVKESSDKENFNNKNPDAESRTLFNYGLTSFPTIKTKQEQLFSKTDKIEQPSLDEKQKRRDFPSMPGPSNKNLCKSAPDGFVKDNNIPHTRNVNNDGVEPSDSWVALIKTVNHNLQERENLVAGVEQDPDSWLNLKRTTRHENKETQTSKPKKSDDQYRTIEIQTELKDMVEIPRSQTFFAEPSSMSKDAINKKTTDFCDRVRQEVIQKLEYQQSLEDKHVQTICHAEVQTDNGTDKSPKNENV